VPPEIVSVSFRRSQQRALSTWDRLQTSPTDLIACKVDAPNATSAVSRTIFCRRDYRALRSLVFAIFTQLSRFDGHDVRGEPVAGSIYDLEMGAGLRAGIECANSPRAEAHQRCCWRTDETYVRVAGRWTYLYRAVDSLGATIDFLLSETRDLVSARRFFQKALAAPGHPRPRVISRDEILLTDRYRRA
jgi:hypothetical protein